MDFEEILRALPVFAIAGGDYLDSCNYLWHFSCSGYTKKAKLDYGI